MILFHPSPLIDRLGWLLVHSAVWWLSRQIRIERENCCDDLAVTALGDKVEYGRALLALEELQGGTAPLVLCATGGSLLARVRRLLAAEPAPRPTIVSWSAGTVALVLSLLVGLALNWHVLAAGPAANALAKPAGGPADSTDKADPIGEGEFFVKLPDGAKIELLGVGEHPSAGKQWWRADGIPLAEPLDTSSLWDKGPEGQQLRELAVRVRKPAASSAELQLPPFFAGMTRDSGMAEDLLLRGSFGSPPDATELTFKVAYASGAWKIAGESGLGGNTPVPEPEAARPKLEGVVFAPAIIKTTPGTTKVEAIAVAVSHTLRDHERRLVAIDDAGKRHQGVANSREHGTGKPDERVTDRCEFRDLGDATIVRLMLETRPRTSIEFRHVSLKSGLKKRVVLLVDGRPPRSGQIVGRIVDDATGDPVEGALVACGPVVNEHETAGAKFTTDKDGVYRLTGLSPGIYNVWLKQYDKNLRQTAVADDGIVVEAGASATSELRLVTGRKVAGRLLDPDSRPVADKGIGCYSTARPISAAGVQTAKTGADGSFEFFLPPGPANFYTLEGGFGEAGGRLSANEHFDVPLGGERPPVVLKLQHYEGKFGDASWLKRSTKGTQIVRQDKVENVSGVVVDSAGKPIAKVRVFQADGPATVTDGQGEFALPMARGTQFILNAYAPGFHVWFGTPTTGDVLKIVMETKPPAGERRKEKPAAEPPPAKPKEKADEKTDEPGIVPAEGESEPVELKAGPKSEQGLKIILGEK